MKMLWVDVSNQLRVDYLVDTEKPNNKALRYLEDDGWSKSVHTNSEVAVFVKFCSKSHELATEWED